MQAISIGSEVPSSFVGQIHSLFQHTVNVQVAGLEILLAVFVSETTDLPQGIRVPPKNFLTRSMAPGQRVILQAGTMRLGELAVNVCGSLTYSGELDQALVEPFHFKQRLVWLQQAYHAVRQCRGYAPEGSLENRTAAAINLLQDSARRQDQKGIHQAASALVGLGPGLTPSGDDILVGFSAGLTLSAGSSQERRAVVNTFCAALREAAARTSDISRTYLLLAAKGRYSSSLRSLCRAVWTAAPRQSLEKTAQIIFQTGHTSGCDTVRGLLAGAAVWP